MTKAKIEANKNPIKKHEYEIYSFRMLAGLFTAPFDSIYSFFKGLGYFFNNPQEYIYPKGSSPGDRMGKTFFATIGLSRIAGFITVATLLLIYTGVLTSTVLGIDIPLVASSTIQNVINYQKVAWDIATINILEASLVTTIWTIAARTAGALLGAVVDTIYYTCFNKSIYLKRKPRLEAEAELKESEPAKLKESEPAELKVSHPSGLKKSEESEAYVGRAANRIRWGMTKWIARTAVKTAFFGEGASWHLAEGEGKRFQKDIKNLLSYGGVFFNSQPRGSVASFIKQDLSHSEPLP